MSDGVVVRCLGPMEVSIRGVPVDGLDDTKTGALLAYLVQEAREPLSRTRLAGLFWPEVGERTARNNLRQTLHHLRQRLPADPGGEGPLLVSREAVGLDSRLPCWLDTGVIGAGPECCGGHVRTAGCRAALDLMQQSVSVYRGPFLQGFTASELPQPVMEWLLQRRTTLRDRARSILEQVAHCLARAEAPDRALDPLRRFLQVEPLDETVHRLLLWTLYNADRCDEAVEHYERLARTLASELDVAPDAATAALRDRAVARRREIRQSMQAAGEPELQRRLVTVVAVCLQLPADWDSEERVRGIAEMTRQAGVIADEHGGLAGRSHGGRLVLYFGYPVASGSATIQAVRAGLRITREALSGSPGSARVAVHSGRMLTAGSTALPDPSGELSDAALRLAEAAPAGECVVTDTVHERVRVYFDTVRVGNGEQTIGLHRVTGDRGIEDRVALSGREGGMSPLIGREDELRRLRQAWEGVRGGRFALVAMEGEPGIGKSRLVQRLVSEVRAREEGLAVVMRCNAETLRQPLLPVIRALREHLPGTDADGSDDQWVARVNAFVEAFPGMPPGSAGVLGRLIEADGAWPNALISEYADPAQGRDSVLGLLVGVAAAMAARMPLLLVVEDLHWSDSTTAMLLRRFVQELADCPVMVLVTARSGTTYPWRVDDPVERLLLRRLDARESAELFAVLEGSDRLSAAVRERILYHGDGIPLFIEELVRHYRLRAPSENVPATLQDLLAGRMEALAEARGLAQLAATLGREFDGERLAAISTLDGDDLERGIAHLIGIGFLERLNATARTPGRYRFRHSLIREAVYESQVDSERRRAHARIAEVLRERYPDSGRESPEVLARHLAAAGNAEEALPYFVRAGYRMLARAAHMEALSQFSEAHDIVDGLPENGTRREWMVDVLLGLGLSRMACSGYGAAEVYATFRRAAELHDGASDPQRHFLILWAQWESSSSHDGFAESQRLADEMERIATASGGRHMRIASDYAQVNTRFYRGDLPASRVYLESVLAAYDNTDHLELVSRFGDNPAFTARSLGAMTLWNVGAPGRARCLIDETVALVDITGHPPSRAFCYTFRALLAQCRDDPAMVRQDAEHVLAIAQARDYALWQRAGQGLLGWAMARDGDHEGVELCERAAADVRHVMYGASTSLLRLHIAGLMQLSRYRRAREVLGGALSDVARIGNRCFLPELYRWRAELAMHLSGDRGAAARDLEDAEAVAERQGAALEQLRVHIAQRDLGVVPHRTADRDHALEAVLARFEDGQDLADVRRAREMLGRAGA
ncbi:AAA family ATPase [Arhodomonas aquaeolei]|uniref:AAA family ATPase n=1 Tax=Arhodomonas aquaeolei TaxID=2369 RepID=UPI002169AB98|nr:AAA family ATPase [Arhodomonas aquaeolei]